MSNAQPTSSDSVSPGTVSIPSQLAVATGPDSEKIRQDFSQRRSRLLEELRCIPGFVNTARQLKPEELYRIVLAPEGATLYQDAAGNFKGVFYKDGKIVQQARFQSVRPSMVKAATAIGSQILLVSISMQLHRIEKSISRLFTELHSDRVAEVQAGIELHRQAMLATDRSHRDGLLFQAAARLNTGIGKSVSSLKRQIADAPDEKIGFLDNWIKNKSSQAVHAFSMAEESFKACLMGMETLVSCYVAIGEPDAAACALRGCIEKIDACDIAAAARKSRLVPLQQGWHPAELPWNRYLEYRGLIHQTIAGFERLGHAGFESLAIEFKPRELLEQ